ncbi:MAG TPA: LysM peptidoglycan-binding domain-containing protein [Vicinamibacteria bacterium]|nr:LysM peptidoglycan-binding domain-containing protein [Vicinamibacteria bacterium]
MGTLCGAAALALVLVHAEAQEPAAPAAPAAASAEGGLLVGPATIPRHWSKYQYPETIPDGARYYIIVRGDTLWDISKRFLGNPFLWPQIWDANRYITDAHWIYPGDPLIIPDINLVSDQAGQAAVDEGMPVEPAAATGVTEALVPAIEETALQCAHYVLDGREDESLHLIGTEEGAVKNVFADRDILYLSKGSNAGVKPGDLYSIHHASYDVKHPETQKRIGVKIEVTGWGRVILAQENSATLVVEQACSDIHLGDYLKPFERLNVPLISRHAPPDRLTPPTGKIVGTVVDIQDDAAIAGDRNLVTVNLGTANGVAPGNLLTVFKTMYPSVPTPRNVIGELVVVAVRERTATARVLYSRDAIMNGDKAELQ